MMALLLLWGLLITLGCAGAQTSQPDPGPGSSAQEPRGAVVQIGEATYDVDLAISPEERQQGLSGREHMARDTGMLFVFENERARTFWMKEMHFPLDMIWIDAQCRLLDVSANVPLPPPGASNDEIPRVQSPGPAQYVLEVNAGEAARNGFRAGDLVEFQGAIEGQHGC